MYKWFCLVLKSLCSQNTRLFGVGLLWFCGVIFLAGRALSYDNTPTTAKVARSQWPARTSVAASAQPTLVMLDHPACPCTRASLRELENIVAHDSGHLRVVLLKFHPRVLPAGWHPIAPLQVAPGLQGAKTEIVDDLDGHQARLFGLSVSGQTALYDGQQRLVFSGGITVSRGHEGESPGSEAIIEFLKTGHIPISHTPVFGCAAFSDSMASDSTTDGNQAEEGSAVAVRS